MKLAFLAQIFVAVCSATSSVIILSGPTAHLRDPQDDCLATGHIRSIQIETRDNEGQRSRVTARCVYNHRDEVIEQSLYSYTPEGTDIQRFVNIYDNDGRLIESGIYDVEDNSHKPMRFVNTFDSQGQVVESTTFNSDGEVDGQDVVEYDSRGDAVKTTWYTFDHKIGGITIRRFDANHRVLFEQTGTGEPTEYRYNEAGRLVEKSFNNAEGGPTRWLYKYDEQGRNSSVETIVAGEVRNKSTYKYDLHGLLTEEQVVQPSGLVVKLARYAYDDHDNHIQESIYDAARSNQPAGNIRVEVDGHPQFFSTTNGLPEITYTLDRQGNWIKAVETRVPYDNPAGKREIRAITRRTIRYY